jgi:hypothetical protein
MHSPCIPRRRAPLAHPSPCLPRCRPADGEFGDRATRRRRGEAYGARPKGHKQGLGSHTWANKFGYSAFSNWLTFTNGVGACMGGAGRAGAAAGF